MNFIQKVIVIPEKLTALAAAGILYLIVQFEIWLSHLTGVDFTTISGTAIAVALAAGLTMVVKVLLEKYVPEQWHTYINSFLAWLATVVMANFLLKSLL